MIAYFVEVISLVDFKNRVGGWKMKKVWSKPELVMLCRGKPEEFVLLAC